MSGRTALLLAVTAVSAACGLVIEIVAGRMIAPYLGMSLYTWTAIIAVVLAGFSIGHWIGGRIAAQPVAQSTRNIAWSLLLAGISAAASLLLIRVLSGPILRLGMPPVPTILIFTSTLFFLPSLFVGIPSPALTRLAIEDNKKKMGQILGQFYAAGAAGSILGTLLAGYLFISWLGTVGTILAVSGAYIVMAGIVFLLDGRKATDKAMRLPLVLTLAAVAVLVLGGAQLRAFHANCNIESNYYCIRLIDLEDHLGLPAKSMILDHLEHGVNVRDEPTLLLAPYVEAQASLAHHHISERTEFDAFFIGGGAYTLPRAWLEKYPGANIHVAELDPAVTDIARRALWLASTDRLRITHDDARRTLNSSGDAKYHIVIGDAFHDISVPQHLVTREFFSLVRNHLTPDGLYLMNVVDHLERPRLVLSIVKTLASVFPIVEVWRANASGQRATFLIAALHRNTRVARLPSQVSEGLAFERISAAQLKQLSQRLVPMILSDDYAPVDRLIAVR